MNKDIESGNKEEALKFYRDNSYILIFRHGNCMFLIIFISSFHPANSEIKEKYAKKIFIFFRECLMSI